MISYIFILTNFDSLHEHEEQARNVYGSKSVFLNLIMSFLDLNIIFFLLDHINQQFEKLVFQKPNQNRRPSRIDQIKQRDVYIATYVCVCISL